MRQRQIRDKSNKPGFFVKNSFAKFTILSFDQTLKFTLSFQISNSLWSTNRINIFSRIVAKYLERSIYILPAKIGHPQSKYSFERL